MDDDDLLQTTWNLTQSSNWTAADHASNITSSAEFPYSSMETFYQAHLPGFTVVNRYLTIIWYVIGFPGNLLALAVWIQPRMRHSSGCYLAALAAADFLFLLLHVVFELQTSWDVPVLDRRGVCEGFPVIFYSTQYLSPLLVLAFTVERYISVCWPFQRDRFCTTKRAVIVIIGVTCGVVLLHVVQAYFWKFSGTDCDVRPEIAENVWTIWSWTTELLVFFVVPVAILILNILVIVATQRINDNMDKLLDGGRRRSMFAHRPSATTVTLLSVSFFHISTTLPVTICYSLYFTFPAGNSSLSTDDQIAADPQWQRHLTYYGVKVVIEELGMTHYAANFLIYAATGLNFRTELRMLVRRWFPCLVTCFRFAYSKICRCRRNSSVDDSFELRQSQVTAIHSAAVQNGNGNYRMVRKVSLPSPSPQPARSLLSVSPTPPPYDDEKTQDSPMPDI